MVHCGIHYGLHYEPRRSDYFPNAFHTWRGNRLKCSTSSMRAMWPRLTTKLFSPRFHNRRYPVIEFFAGWLWPSVIWFLCWQSRLFFTFLVRCYSLALKLVRWQDRLVDHTGIKRLPVALVIGSRYSLSNWASAEGAKFWPIRGRLRMAECFAPSGFVLCVSSVHVEETPSKPQEWRASSTGLGPLWLMSLAKFSFLVHNSP